MDDSNIFDSEPGRAASSNAYLRERYKTLNIPVSTKNSWDPTQLPIIPETKGGCSIELWACLVKIGRISSIGLARRAQRGNP